MADDINIALSFAPVAPLLVQVEFNNPIETILVQVPAPQEIEFTLPQPNFNIGMQLRETVLLKALAEKNDLFNPADGQTAFTLSEVVTTGAIVKMFVNGLRIYSFTRSGQNITYTGNSYTMKTTDLIEFIYT